MGANDGIISGTTKKVMKLAVKDSGVRQMELAERLNMAQASVSGNINRTKIGMDVFVKIVNAMGYAVMIGEKTENGFEEIVEVDQNE